MAENVYSVHSQFWIGTNAERLAYTPDASTFGVYGVRWWETDTDHLYIYEGAWVRVDADVPTHAANHENGGGDEISVAGLSGELADNQPPKAHKASHQNGGADEISVAGLSGELADNQPPKAHKANHEVGGTDVITGAITPSSVTTTNTCYIGDNANGNMTLGLTINQGGADNEIYAGKSSDVAHGITTIVETDTFFDVQKVAAAAGGATIRGFSADTIGMLFAGIATNDNTTKTTGGSGAIELRSYKKNGTTIGDMGANANLAVIRNNATTRFIFDAEGSAHADVEWIAFDEYDDLAMLDDLQTAMTKDRVKEGFADFLRYNPEALEAAGIVHFDPDAPGHAMLNTTRHQMLLNGASRQLGAKVKEQADEINELRERIQQLENLLQTGDVT